MTSILDTFLQLEEFNKVSDKIAEYLDELSQLPREKKLKRIKQLFEFKKLFSTDSVQGMAGILQIDTGLITKTGEEHVDHIMQDVVFKVSIEINRSIEHEFFVLRKLNALRAYCPNFVGTLGMLPAYVTRDFFEEEDQRKGNIMDVKSSPVQANYLLLEYVSDVTFRHVWKHAPKATVTGILLGVLCALQVAQNKLDFVHYDLHSGNILMRKVEDDAYFAYVIDGKVIMYPTFGWYPVIIDMGSSYIRGIEERPTRTSIAHYHRGLQSTYYDRISDIHHFLLSAVSRLEKADTQSDDFRRHFRVIATRVMHMFRHSNVWRYNGWKQLPVNLIHSFNSLVNKTRPQMCEFFTEFRSQVVDTLALGVKLPWAKLDDDAIFMMARVCYSEELAVTEDMLIEEIERKLLKASVEDVNHFLKVFDDDPVTKADAQIFFALRTLVEQASLLPDIGKDVFQQGFTISKETTTNYKQIMQPMYASLNFKLNLNRSFRGAYVLCRLMRHYLFNFNQDNVELVKEWSEKSEVREPKDAIAFIKQNTGVRYAFEKHSPVYVWDSDSEKHVKTTFGELGIKDDMCDMEAAVLRFMK